MNSSNNNNWIYENPLFKNKNQRYYYDFGTDDKIERKEVKEQRDAILNSANKTSTEPQKQKNDDFLEGFNDPYGENRERERMQKEQERKERLARIRANADKRDWASQTDPFLDGFNGTSNEQRVKFPNAQLHATPSNTNLMFPNTQLQAKPQDYGLIFPNTKLQSKPPMFPNTQLHSKPQNNDAFLEGFNYPSGEMERWEEETISNSNSFQPNILSIAPMGREGSMWCWIAAASMVDKYYHPENFASQGKISTQLGKEERDGGYIEETPKLGKGSRSCTTSGFSDRISPSELTYEKIQEEMQGKHPIVLLTETGDKHESEHYVVIVGCYTNGKGERYVIVNETREDKAKKEKPGIQRHIPYEQIKGVFSTGRGAKQRITAFYTTRPEKDSYHK